MAGQDNKTVERLLDKYGQTYAAELRIAVERNTPAVLFQLLVATLLFSARIPAHNAIEATRALIKAKLTTPQKMAAATWQERVDVITWHGYKRYDESAATKLGRTAELVLDKYQGDLRKLREAADYKVEEEKCLLMEFKGIGPVGADIFLREVQLVWDEVYPYADQRVLHAAERLSLATTADELASLVPKEDFPRLTAALVRADLSKDLERLSAA